MKITRESISAFVDFAFRIVLGSVFIYAAWSKLQDPAFFASAVDAYQMLPKPLVAFVAIVLPPAELIAGIVLILSKWQRESAFLILGMLAVFFIGLVQAKIRGLEIGCGCFGNEKNQSVTAALVRDIFLVVPALWLALRKNQPSWNWKIHLPTCVIVGVILACLPLHPQLGTKSALGGKEKDASVPRKTDEKIRRQKTPEEAVAAIFKEFPAPDTNAVVVEKWTQDFPAALARARNEKLPLFMIVDSKSCQYCRRFKKTILSEGFKKWLDGTGVYLVNAHFASTNYPPAGEAMCRFLLDSPEGPNLPGYPYVGVFWEKPSGETIWTVFSGRNGRMKSQRRNSLLLELVSSLDTILTDHLASKPPRPTEDEMLAINVKRISVATEGEGHAKMHPSNGTLFDNGVQIFLEAHPAKGWRFVGWRNPSGKMMRNHNINSKFKVTYDMQSGTYTAVFKRKSKPSSKAPRRPPQGTSSPAAH